MSQRSPIVTDGVPLAVALLVDVRLYRDGLVRALENRSELHVVASAPVTPQALQLLAAQRPEIVLLEVAAARTATIVHSILEALPEARVVAIGSADEELDPVACAEAGAAGYVPSEASLEDLIATIVGVAQGEFPCTPRVASLMARRISSLAARHEELPVTLTVREREILRLIDAGLSNKEIAQRLGIVVSTVKNHVHHILHKTHVTRRAQAAVQLRRWSLTAFGSLP